MVGLATAATVIASQAVITGAFSLTRQAVQLGLLPRIDIRLHLGDASRADLHPADQHACCSSACCCSSFLFQSSSALASAYGIAVTGTMVVDAMLAFVVIWRLWDWQLWAAAALMVPFLLIDTTFLTRQPAQAVRWRRGCRCCSPRFVILLMVTWRRGTRILADKTRRAEVPLDMLVPILEKKPPHRVPGTAVFLTSDPDYAPTALLHNLKHNKVLHENNVILTVATADTPRVASEERVDHRAASSEHFSRVKLKFGYMESAERAARPRHRAQARLDVRHHVDVVLRVAALDQARRAVRTCRCGRTSCSSSSPATPTTPRTSSRSRRAAWWKSARRSRSSRARLAFSRPSAPRGPRGGSQVFGCRPSASSARRGRGPPRAAARHRW